MVMTPEVLTLSQTPVLFTVAMLAKIAIAFAVMLLIVAYATYAERKIIWQNADPDGTNNDWTERSSTADC